MTPAMKKHTTVESYLADCPPDARATLERIRAAVRSAAPSAEEKIGYGMPGFYLDGHPLTYYAAFKAHCSLFPGSATVVKTFAEELRPYEVAKGTIRFPIGKPPPATLIRKIVKERIRENEARFGRR
ncbi:MAG TPA: DUF1801 domain-containing protein [Actinomycetota bacterium]|nr:DUF1801 domain-containing protein [Actinomycetota bacterium]